MSEWCWKDGERVLTGGSISAFTNTVQSLLKRSKRKCINFSTGSWESCTSQGVLPLAETPSPRQLQFSACCKQTCEAASCGLTLLFHPILGIWGSLLWILHFLSWMLKPFLVSTLHSRAWLLTEYRDGLICRFYVDQRLCKNCRYRLSLLSCLGSSCQFNLSSFRTKTTSPSFVWLSLSPFISNNTCALCSKTSQWENK